MLHSLLAQILECFFLALQQFLSPNPSLLIHNGISLNSWETHKISICKSFICRKPFVTQQNLVNGTKIRLSFQSKTKSMKTRKTKRSGSVQLERRELTRPLQPHPPNGCIVEKHLLHWCTSTHFVLDCFFSVCLSLRNKNISAKYEPQANLDLRSNF